MTDNTADSIHQIAEVLGPDTVAKLVEATNKVAVIASAELDLKNLSAREIAGIGAIRDHVLADRELDLDAALEQLAAMPNVAQRLKGQAERERVTNAHAAATANMSPGEKMAYARKHGLTSSGPERTPHTDLTPEEARRRLGELKGAARVAFARKYGLE